MSIFHRHKFEVVAVEHGTFVIMAGTSTTVLYRCNCGKVKTDAFNGLWTIEQVRGESSVTGRERGGYMPGRDSTRPPVPPSSPGAGSQGVRNA